MPSLLNLISTSIIYCLKSELDFVTCIWQLFPENSKEAETQSIYT
jgi:hypothetical protein